ncbi:ATP-dependent helicase, partial [Serratia fonticola]
SWPNGLKDHPQQTSPEVSNFIKWKQIAFAKSREVKGQQSFNSMEQASLRLSEVREALKAGRKAVEQ